MNVSSVVCLVLFFVVSNDAFKVITVDDTKTILALENEELNIECNGSNVTYCSFISPNGIRIPFSDIHSEPRQCSLKTKATKNATGEWKCRTGTDVVGVETIENIQVQVADESSPLVSFISTAHGHEVILACVTPKDNMPLKYCRFEPPFASPFKIDSTVTHKNPIMEYYFYPSNMSLEKGECAVNIARLRLDDVGIWRCFVGLADSDKEHTANIEITLQRYRGVTTLSTAGLIICVVAIFLILCALSLLAWRKLRPLHENREKQVFEIQELGRSSLGSSIISLPNKTRVVPAVVVHSPTDSKHSPMKTI